MTSLYWFIGGFTLAILPCLGLLKQAHREAVQADGALYKALEWAREERVLRFISEGTLEDLRTRYARRGALIRRLRSNATRLRSVACASAFQVGQLEGYLHRAIFAAEHGVNSISGSTPDHVAARRLLAERAHALSTAAWVLYRVTHGA